VSDGIGLANGPGSAISVLPKRIPKRAGPLWFVLKPGFDTGDFSNRATGA
jgi:hypothetical protein